MSEFSGKCDFYDRFVSIGSSEDEEKVLRNLKKLNLYVRGKDGRSHRVKSDTIKDIAKYYPYLESISLYDKENGYRIYLESDSFIDREEAEWRNWKVGYVLKYWRKCKRNKKPFVTEECLNELSWMSKSSQLKEMICRVEKDGNKAEFDDIHDSMHEYFRRKWFEELVRLGYTEREAYDWCFNAFFDNEETIIQRLGRPLHEIQSGKAE